MDLNPHGCCQDFEHEFEDLRDKLPSVARYAQITLYLIDEEDLDGIEWAIGKMITYVRAAQKAAQNMRETRATLEALATRWERDRQETLRKEAYRNAARTPRENEDDFDDAPACEREAAQ
ncbi:hypothetical protein RZS28_00660 [Methylocapsa polymorpha]|uniref:Uncharacterized protein n=1 Tax=Methylocapsa polymorpha TaxID=3080828 RepID=A0ABZ0HSJ6_9HYPH|nr:hypothetical protein RZS28_00660 [Methylocapsa sp. RX1]